MYIPFIASAPGSFTKRNVAKWVTPKKLKKKLLFGSNIFEVEITIVKIVVPTSKKIGQKY